MVSQRINQSGTSISSRNFDPVVPTSNVLNTGPDPLWNDLLKRHAKEPIHLLVGGGDQIYCDAIAREPEITPWIDETNTEKKMQSGYPPLFSAHATDIIEHN